MKNLVKFLTEAKYNEKGLEKMLEKTVKKDNAAWLSKAICQGTIDYDGKKYFVSAENFPFLVDEKAWKEMGVKDDEDVVNTILTNYRECFKYQTDAEASRGCQGCMPIPTR